MKTRIMKAKDILRKITFISSIVFIVYVLFNLLLPKCVYSILKITMFLDINAMASQLDFSYIYVQLYLLL